MSTESRQSLYQKAVHECRYEIQNGTLDAGMPFYSRNELCRKFSISLVTAHKVQRVLVQQGLIIPQAGGRFIVNKKIKMHSAVSDDLRKVRVIGSPKAIEGECYGGQIVAGVRAGCAERNLQFEIDLVDVMHNPPGYINASRCLETDEGLIVMLHEALAPEVAPLLMNPTIRAVTVNSFFPYRAAVLPDYRNGIHEQFQEAVSRGAKKLMFCNRLEYAFSPIIATIREELAKAEGERLGIELILDISGNFRHIAENIREQKPDAVFFMNDLAAIHFKQHFLRKSLNHPRIIGCDNYGPKEELAALSTWDTNPFGMGKASVELLCGQDTLSRPYTRFVPGKLIIRD